MSAVEAAAFEEHYLTCAECQREIQFATLVRAGLRETMAPRRSARRPALWIGMSLALAAGIAALVVFRPLSRANKWRDLGAVSVAPIYLGVEVRGTPARNDSLFAAAMNAYNERRYVAAAAGLRAALVAGADSTSTQFFLGASLLMEGKAGEADAAFARVIAAGNTLYQGEARLYRAKALLLEGRAADAVKELHAVTSVSSAVTAWARALADSVESRLRR